MEKFVCSFRLRGSALTQTRAVALSLFAMGVRRVIVAVNYITTVDEAIAQAQTDITRIMEGQPAARIVLRGWLHSRGVQNGKAAAPSTDEQHVKTVAEQKAEAPA